MFTTVVWAFLKRGALEALSYRAAFAMRVAGMLTTLTALYFFAQFVDSAHAADLGRYGGDYLSFGLAGLVLLNLQHATVSAYPLTIRTAQMAGTLEAMLATPTPSWLVLLCAPIYRLAAALIGSVLVLVLGGAAFGVHFSGANLGSLIVALPLCPLAFASIGFLGATLTMLLRRTDPISLFVGGISALAGGVFYPTTVLPQWLEVAGKLLPITHALELVRRAAFAGADLHQLGPSLAALAIMCIIAGPLGLASFVWAVRRARRDGSLSHY